MLPGDAFYSKALGKNLIFQGTVGGVKKFVGVAYATTSYTEQQVGVLEPLVRQCHYDAAIGLSERLISAFDEELALVG